MASTLDIIIQAQDRASATFRQVGETVGGISSSLAKMSQIAGGFVIGKALTELPNLLMSSVNAAAEDAASVARLQQAVDNTGASYSTYSKTIDGVIKNGQNLGFTDDQTRFGLAILTAQTGDAGEAMKRYALAQDLARGANIDVVTASRLLGKVTEENVNVLNRYGISVQKGASETELFAAIQQKFGGQAAAFADTTAGKMAILNDRIAEGKEAIGSLLIPAFTNATSNAIVFIDTLMKIPPILSDIGIRSKVDIGVGTVNAFQVLANAVPGGAAALAFFSNDLGKAQDKLSAAGPWQAWASGQSAFVAGQSGATSQVADFTNGLTLLQQHLSGLNPALTDLAVTNRGLVNAQMDSIRTTQEHADVTEQAYAKIATLTDATSVAITTTHNQELADKAAAVASAEASKAKSAQAEAAAAFAKTVPGMVAALYDEAAATRDQYTAQMIFNEQMGIATNRMGEAILPLQNLIDAQLDQIDASVRQAAATRIASQQSFPQLVAAQKEAILTSQLMEKATAQANKELGITDKTARSAADGIDGLTKSATEAIHAFEGVMWGPHGEWVPISNGSSGGSTSGGGTAKSGGGGTAAFIHRASGGPIVPGVAYMVGEHGPETFVSGASGSIIPNGGVVINVNVSGSINGVDDVKRIIRDAINGGGFRGVLAS